MAFRLAEAYIELKARGEKELHKSLDKTKDKVEDVGAATEQTEKSLERSAQQAAKGVEKSADNMATALQKPIDKLEQFEREMKAKFDSLKQRSQQLKQDIGSDTGGSRFTLGPTNSVFGRFGGAANLAAGAALVGIAKAVADRGAEISSGATSEVMGPAVTSEVRDIVDGIKEVGGAFKDVAGGFVDGLLTFVAILANVATFGGLGALGSSARSERDRVAAEMGRREELIERRRRIAGAMEPIEAFERRREVDDLFRTRGMSGLVSEQQRILGSEVEQRSLDGAERLRLINERIVQEKEKSRQLSDATAAAVEREAAAAERARKAQERARGVAWDDARLNALQLEEAVRTGRDPALLRMRDALGLSDLEMRGIESDMQRSERARGQLRVGPRAERFANMSADRLAAIVDENNKVSALRREYEKLAAEVAALPPGATRNAAQQQLEAAQRNVNAAEALMEQRAAEQARQRGQQRRERFGEGIVGGILRGVLGEFDFQQSNRPRNTASFQTVPVEQFARLIEADIAAKEEEKQRVEEAKRMHEEAQAERERIANAAEETARAVANGIAAVFG